MVYRFVVVAAWGQDVGHRFRLLLGGCPRGDGVPRCRQWMMLGLPFSCLKWVAGAVVGQAVSHAVSRAEGWAYSAVGLVAPLS